MEWWSGAPSVDLHSPQRFADADGASIRPDIQKMVQSQTKRTTAMLQHSHTPSLRVAAFEDKNEAPGAPGATGGTKNLPFLVLAEMPGRL